MSPPDPDRREPNRREDVFRTLMAFGATREELERAEREHRLALMVGELVLWSDRERITVAEAARRSGVDESIVRAALLRLGLPDPGDAPTLSKQAVDALLVLRGGAELFGEDAMLQFARVVGAACSSVAEAAVSVFGASIASGRLPADVDPVEYTATVIDTTLAFTTLGPAIDVVLRQHFEVASARLSPANVGHDQQFAIAFVDLVGSTALSQRIDASELAGALAEFDDRATEIASLHEVRLVKLVGDGAMFAARRPADVVAACLALLAAVSAHPVLGDARAGAAYGYVAVRDGDYYGLVVNLAARIASVAAPGEMLGDSGVATALSGRAEPAGSHRLKGFDTPVPVFRIR